MGCGDKSGCGRDWLCDDCVRALEALWCGDGAMPCVPPLEGLAAAYAYRDPAAALVRSLKYGSVGLLAGMMAADMARACAALPVPGTALVVPTPMHPRRERRRGYNQAELLSREVARRLGLAHARALTKLRNTRQQARLDHEQRAENLRGSIAAGVEVRGTRRIADRRRIHHRRDHARLRPGAAGRGRGVRFRPYLCRGRFAPPQSRKQG